jgi:hypothetical protein
MKERHRRGVCAGVSCGAGGQVREGQVREGPGPLFPFMVSL